MSSPVNPVPSVITPTPARALPKDGLRGEPSQAEKAGFAALAEAAPGGVPPNAATLAAMAAIGGKTAVAGRMEARRLARKRREQSEAETADTIVAEDAPPSPPPVAPMIGRPPIDLDQELEAVKKARSPARGIGPLTAFLAQQMGQSGGFAASLGAPLRWLINAYVRHQAPEKREPKPNTLSVS